MLIVGGDVYLAEKMVEVYEAYDMDIQSVGRGRGSVIVTTDKGIRQISPFAGTDERLAEEKLFKDKMYEKGFCYVDRVVPNIENELITCDRYGNAYVMRQFFEGRECSPNNIRELEKSVINLAQLHRAGREIYLEENREYAGKTPGGIEKKLGELRRIRNFVSKRNKKNDFELMYIKNFDYFYSQALACKRLYDEQFVRNDKWIGYCHGSYNYHSVLFCDGFIATTNFDKFHVGYQLVDVYQFLRKALEKNDYDVSYARDILDSYSQIQQLGKEDYRFIYIMLSFPEKFWKISNRYMNLRKNYISPVLMDKLTRVIEDEQQKSHILSEFSNIYGLHNR